MRSKAFSLEETLLMNAADTITKNVKAYDAPVLITVVQAILEREDLAPSVHRLLATSLTAGELEDMGVSNGMAGVGDDAMNFLTMPKMHRTLLRGIQQMQETLMPGGYLLKNREIDHADATRMLRDCTTQMEKVLRLTKGVKAQADMLRLKEAIADGLKAIGQELGEDIGKRAFKIMESAIVASMTKNKPLLEEALQDAEELT